MRLFYITNSRIPTSKAHGYAISKMCEQFSELGTEVSLVIPKKKNNVYKDIFNYYNVKRNFKIRKLPFLNLPSFKISFFSKAGFFIKRLSFLISCVFLRTKKDDIIYIRNVEQLILWRLKRRKVFLEIHFLSNIEKKLSFLLKKAGKIIVITNQLKKDISRIGNISENKIIIAHDAVDLDIFDIGLSREKARKRLKLPQNKKMLGYTGSFKTMGEDKGINDILKSIKILSEDFDILFVAVGGSRQDIEYYSKKVKELNVSDKVKFVEKVKLNKLAVYQKACDILLMPFPNKKHYAYYMSPLKMFEYMASKRPIIASDLPSIREVLDQNNSVLTDPDNPKKLAQVIQKTLNNEELSVEISNQAYKDVQNYTWQKRTQKILNFINENR